MAENNGHARRFFMKKIKWIYVFAAVVVIGVAVLLVNNPEIIERIPLMALSVLIGLALMLGVALVAVWIMRRRERRDEKFRDGAVAVTGWVARVEKLPVKQRQGAYGMGEELYLLRAIYDYEGKRYTGAKRSYFGKPDYQVGDPITVYVDPKDPTRSKILSDRSATDETPTA